jgi:lipopolysaccharide biosynthesis glycosyltransferase
MSAAGSSELRGPQVLVSIDDRYAPVLPTLLRSIAANSPTAEVIILAADVSDRSSAKLEAFCNGVIPHRYVPFVPDVKTEPLECHVQSIATFSRLFAPRLLPDVHKVIYLDVDTLVLTDLAPLYAHETGDCGLAGVLDLYDSTLRAQLTSFYLSKPHVGYVDPATPAFNSGVLLMDLDKMRREAALPTMLGMLERNYMLDQPLLNLYSNGRFRMIDRSWNVSANHLERLPPNQRLGILHWHGPEKPWERTRPLQEHYERYRVDFAGLRTTSPAS